MTTERRVVARSRGDVVAVRPGETAYVDDRGYVSVVREGERPKPPSEWRLMAPYIIAGLVALLAIYFAVAGVMMAATAMSNTQEIALASIDASRQVNVEMARAMGREMAEARLAAEPKGEWNIGGGVVLLGLCLVAMVLAIFRGGKVW